MKVSRLLTLAAVCLPLAVTLAQHQTFKLKYPETRRVEHVDIYHGTKVADPYRWLEDDVRESAEVADWVEQQNKVAFGYLESIPERERIEKRIHQLWDYEKFGTPFRAGDRFFYYHNSGLQNQSVLYTLKSLDGTPQILFDPNTWSKDGTVALAGTRFSDDGKYVAYGIQDAGSDWRTWRVMEVESGKKLDDELKWVKFSSPTWKKDGSGFYYGAFDEPADDQQFQSLNLNQKLYFHKLGTPQSEDELIYERPDQPEWGFDPRVTEDGRYLVITVWKGTDDKYRVLYVDLENSNSTPVELINNFDNEYSLIGNEGSVFYFKTDLNAPMKKVIAIDFSQPERANWKTIVPEDENVLTGVSFVGDRFLCKYLKDAKTQVKQFTMLGKLEREINFPGLGSAFGFGGKRDYQETFYSFSSFATPSSIYRYDIATGKSTLYKQSQVQFNPADYEVQQVFFTSKDGTKVPMFIAHKKGIELNGNNPTLLYGYGGFNIPLSPSFSISRLAWMEMGGVYVQANLRGGGEYGEKWHRAGTKLNKQNVFDDFISAAEWLIEKKYTSSKKLAIQGGSNGGLLVGACMTQRPDLFAACLPAVGVMDMLRFHKFTAGRFWVDDYGSADNADEFAALYKYSPYHNLKPGTAYPATMVTTADTDDRVVPGHSFKFAARLQKCHVGDNPVLIRIETKAGHGSGKPTSKIIEELADVWAFLVKNLDFEPVLPE